MSLTVGNIPNEPAAWPEWLERQLVGAHLGELVAELELLQRGVETHAISLSDLCGGELAEVHEQGLSALTDEQIRDLLRHPELLLELQESVLVHGGDYWASTTQSATSTEHAAASWNQVAAASGINEGTASAGHSGPNATTVSGGTSNTVSAPPRRRLLVWLGAVSAGLLIGLGVWLNRPSTPSWGFDRGDLLTANVSGSEYLDSLADAAEDWFNKRPQQAHGVLRRLREFEHGCDELIAAPHPQLAATDRQWLVERCHAWKGKLVAHAAELEAGRLSPINARDAADETVQLQQALRERATSLAG